MGRNQEEAFTVKRFDEDIMYDKLATELDAITDQVQSLGFTKLAEDLDLVANTISHLASIGPTGMDPKYIGAEFLGYNYKSMTMNKGDLIKREWGDQVTKKGVVSPDGSIGRAADGGTLVYVIDPKATGSDKTRPINLSTFTGTIAYKDGRTETLENAKKIESTASPDRFVKTPGEQETPNLEGVMYRGMALLGRETDGNWAEIGVNRLLGNNGTGVSRKDGKGLWVEVNSSTEGNPPAFFLLPSFSGISYKGSDKEIYIDGKKEDLARFKSDLDSHYKKLGSTVWKALEGKPYNNLGGLEKLRDIFVTETVKLGGSESVAYTMCPFPDLGKNRGGIESYELIKTVYAQSRKIPESYIGMIGSDFRDTSTSAFDISPYSTIIKVLKVIDTHFSNPETISAVWDEATAVRRPGATPSKPSEVTTEKEDGPKNETPPTGTPASMSQPAEFTKASFTGKGLLKIQREGKWQEMEKPLAGNLSSEDTHKDEKGTWVEIKSKREGGPSAYLLVDSFVGDVEKDGKKTTKGPTTTKEARLSYTKLAHVVDTVANELQAKGLLKQAAELDLVANELDSMDNY
jgi:hypothetical protein